MVSSSQDDCNKRTYEETADNEAAEDDVSKRKKRKDNEEKEPMGKPAPVARGGPGRYKTFIILCFFQNYSDKGQNV